MNLDSIFQTATAKVLDYFIDEYELNQDLDHSKAEVQTGTKCSMRNIIRIFPILKNLGLITQTRTLGLLTMWKLSDDSAVKHLVDLRKSLRVMGNEE